MAARYPSTRKCPLLPAVITGASMVPTLADGDYVLVLRSRRLAPGDLVALRDPRLPQRIVVKRAAARTAAGWWVVGDNRAASTDSRTFGAVPPELVVGRVLLRYWPRLRVFVGRFSARSDQRIWAWLTAPRVMCHFRSTSP